MMETSKPVYLVTAYSDPVVIRVEGRASFHNSAGLQDFLNECFRQGKTRFVVDFQNCTSMDSTFLGVLAGVAMRLRKQAAQPPGVATGSLVLARLGQRNLELVRNLGLHHLATVDSGEAQPGGGAMTPLSHREQTAVERARLALEAHENLIMASEGNRSKFQDVLEILKKTVESKRDDKR